ncbi:MAG: hypothetical protein J0H15_13810 [Xanthomonadales bacterium]|nr:hypothetical protein [Xanthomonadales bacterium]
MLVAPLPATSSPARARPLASPRRLCRTGRRRGAGTGTWLLAWLGAGVSALLLYPDLRGGSAFGLTLPFWLVAAPLIDLAWLRRRRLGALLAQRFSRRTRRSR